MIRNDQMKAGRFADWQQYRRLCARIVAHLNAGRIVMVATYTRATEYHRQHAGMFTANRSGVFVERGKSRVCIHFCAIRFF